jgi:hypothetical protein
LISEMISGSKLLSRRRLISEDVFTFLSSKILYSFLASDIWLFNEKIFQRDLSPKKIWDIKKINISKEKNVIRFKSKIDGSTILKDLVQGDVEIENSTIEDFIIFA